MHEHIQISLLLGCGTKGILPVVFTRFCRFRKRFSTESLPCGQEGMVD